MVSSYPMAPRLLQMVAYRLRALASIAGLLPPKIRPIRTFVARLQDRLTGLASIADQTDGRVVLRLRGSRVRDVLAKGVPLDLHHRSFKTGDIASTLVAYIGVQIEQLDDAPTFQLMAFRSLCRKFVVMVGQVSSRIRL